MTNIQILTAFETEINLIDNSLNKPVTDDSLFWLNQAVGKFVKLRFNGDPIHHTGYEQTEKRREDLIRLVCTEELSCDKYDKSHANYNEYTYEYPEDYLYVLSENVIISDNKGENEMDTCMFECTLDNFMYRINNSLTDFHYRFHRARPLRIRYNKGSKLLTDKNYKINKYILSYLRKPKEISLENPFDEYEDFQDIIMHEIIKIAAQMYLENKKDERYQTISAEILTQE